MGELRKVKYELEDLLDEVRQDHKKELAAMEERLQHTEDDLETQVTMRKRMEALVKSVHQSNELSVSGDNLLSGFPERTGNFSERL